MIVVICSTASHEKSKMTEKGSRSCDEKGNNDETKNGNIDNSEYFDILQ